MPGGRPVGSPTRPPTPTLGLFVSFESRNLSLKIIPRLKVLDWAMINTPLDLADFSLDLADFSLGLFFNFLFETARRTSQPFVVLNLLQRWTPWPCPRPRPSSPHSFRSASSPSTRLVAPPPNSWCRYNHLSQRRGTPALPAPTTAGCSSSRSRRPQFLFLRLISMIIFFSGT